MTCGIILRQQLWPKETGALSCTIACGDCFSCRHGFHSSCERTNPNFEDASKL
jgi:hypothetical protein